MRLEEGEREREKERERKKEKLGEKAIRGLHLRGLLASIRPHLH
jgi:hypothetical protein